MFVQTLVLSQLSCSSCYFSGRPVLSVLSRLTSPEWSAITALFQMLSPSFSVIAVLPQLFCLGCSFLAVLSCHILIILSYLYLSFHSCPVPTVLSRFLSWCPVLALFVAALLCLLSYLLTCSDFPVLSVLSRLSVLTVLFWLSYTTCSAVVVMWWLYLAVLT